MLCNCVYEWKFTKTADVAVQINSKTFNCDWMSLTDSDYHCRSVDLKFV